MKTASFFSYTGPGRVSIARFPPRGTPAGFKVYKPLAPGSWFATVDQETYRKLYFAQLALLKPALVADDLQRLAGDSEPVLLCWERAIDIESGAAFCHRRMLAEWLHSELGIVVPERI